MKTGTHVLSSGFGRTAMLKIAADGSGLLTVQTGGSAAVRVALHQSELAALKDVL
jgi:hypothetical protein